MSAPHMAPRPGSGLARPETAPTAAAIEQATRFVASLAEKTQPVAGPDGSIRITSAYDTNQAFRLHAAYVSQVLSRRMAEGKTLDEPPTLRELLEARSVVDRHLVAVAGDRQRSGAEPTMTQTRADITNLTLANLSRTFENPQLLTTPAWQKIWVPSFSLEASLRLAESPKWKTPSVWDGPSVAQRHPQQQVASAPAPAKPSFWLSAFFGNPGVRVAPHLAYGIPAVYRPGWGFSYSTPSTPSFSFTATFPISFGVYRHQHQLHREQYYHHHRHVQLAHAPGHHHRHSPMNRDHSMFRHAHGHSWGGGHGWHGRSRWG